MEIKEEYLIFQENYHFVKLTVIKNSNQIHRKKITLD